MANLDVMSIRQMIDTTFGAANANTIDFKLLQTILYILARKLNILTRHVCIEEARRQRRQEIMVSELKIHSKSKKRGSKGEDRNSRTKSSAEKDSTETSSAAESSAINSSDKSSTDKNAKYSTTTSSTVQSSAITSSEKSSTDKNAKYSTTTSSTVQSSAITSSEKSSTDKNENFSSSASAAGKSSTASMTTDTDGMKKSGSKNRRKVISSEDDKDSMEILHDKLLIVSRKPSDDVAYSDRDQQGAVAVATQDQYNALVEEVCELQALLGLGTDFTHITGHTQTGQGQVGTDITENLRAKLHKLTSMTNPMAAVNMSARLEAIEKQLAKLMRTATEFAKRTPGINLESAFDDSIIEQKNMSEWILPGVSSQTPPALSKSGAFKQPPPRFAEGGAEESRAFNFNYDEDDLLDESVDELESANLSESTGRIPSELVKVTYDELKDYMDELYDEVVKKVKEVTTRSYTVSGDSYKKMMKLGEKLEASLDLGDRFNKLDQSVENYADTVNYIDTTLCSKMTEAQDALTQMQYDLDVGLDSLAEALAAPSKEVTAMAELKERFTHLHVDLNDTAERQKELKLLQLTCAMDIDDLKRRVKELQDRKASREESAEALLGKASTSALNGIVHAAQFDAVREEFEKRIITSFDAFNNTEFTWQKYIEDVINSINDKIDILQLMSLKQEIQKHLAKLRSDLENLREVLGEIENSGVMKKLERFDSCLSCGANIDVYEDVFGENMLSRPPVIGAESAGVKEDVARKFCIPGRPVPHPIDPRSIHCQHYCGGPGGDHKSSFTVNTSKMERPHTTAVRTDSKNSFPCKSWSPLQRTVYGIEKLLD